jgi:3-isopropylmalate/(R)-2-methylmalate dehydratase large subunit
MGAGILFATMVMDGATMTSPERVTFAGRTLFVTEDASLLRAQLAGVDLDLRSAGPLARNISTDEITPGWVCYYYDETLGRYCLVGLRGGHVKADAIKLGGFSVVVSGDSKGCGSSRETAPYSELAAGVRLVVASSIEKIYRQNAQNIGLLTSTDFDLLPRIARGEAIPIEEFTRGLDPISAGIVERGGLFAYNRARLAGEVSPPAVTTPPRPMTLCEKILAAHVIADARSGVVGAPAVKPGDAFFARADVRFSHEYVTPMAESLFRHGFGDAEVSEPGSVFAFRDHLTFLDLVMSKAHREMGLDVQARKLAMVQEEFAVRAGVKLYGEVRRDGALVGSEAICHNKVVEELALPGQVVVGTDSHTCMAGALGCFAFGVGATDMANAWLTRDVRVTVPETIRFVLTGRLRPGVCAKDVMLHILSRPVFKSGDAIGKVLEFGGEAVRALPLDERATLTNMAVEAGGFTGIVEADEVVVAYLVEQRGLDADDLRGRVVRADPGADYAATFEIDLSTLPPMVATPGDPRNGVPLAELGRGVKIDIAYGGSCTGGKKADMDMYARVLSAALAKGARVAPGVHLYVQFGSQDIRRYAMDRGYLDIFERAGAELVDPSCGACIKAGPGVSDSPDQVTVSAQNRNYPGRSGPGKVYLASPLVVAASAIAGRIAHPEEI